ncbi:carboxypeptidase regulatory-like domain-containing protein [Nocardioides caeni]|uniref:Carboxypeptidase regulatory-like domain-containing protein n=1 Tax=Nocardioides caeni TaxID=574700 RepID=A0A4V4HK82_9ACTN|nr:carboxypeptidase-like regulatory domain-containing protein [Nocardioides caeni]THV13366.1 carboxypeptidase regulatory-like domain-containing protein [Nocardioides caeni]
MKRLLGLVLLLAVACAPGLLPVSASAERGVAPPAPITGRIWDYVGRTYEAGVGVQVWDEPGGTLLGSTTTGSDGSFSVARNPEILIGGPTFVRVISNGRVQGGWIGGGYVQFGPDFADEVADGTSLGRINATPAYIRGRVVNARTGRPVRGVDVALLRAGDNRLVRTARTNAEGVFALRPFVGEDFNLRVDGRAVGYERGFRACNAQVVATIGQACGSPIGAIGRVFLQRR